MQLKEAYALGQAAALEKYAYRDRNPGPKARPDRPRRPQSNALKMKDPRGNGMPSEATTAPLQQRLLAMPTQPPSAAAPLLAPTAGPVPTPPVPTPPNTASAAPHASTAAPHASTAAPHASTAAPPGFFRSMLQKHPLATLALSAAIPAGAMYAMSGTDGRDDEKNRR